MVYYFNGKFIWKELLWLEAGQKLRKLFGRYMSFCHSLEKIIMILMDCVPKNKFDYSSLDNMKNFKMTELILILPNLFEWIQDINWPISKEIIKILPIFGEHLIPEIKKILSSTDDMCQFSCIYHLLPDLKIEIFEKLKDELIRIIREPTIIEKDNKFDEKILEILKTNNLLTKWQNDM